MKKQIDPSAKAYLLRGAFYLLLLLAVSAIPFALAQRNSVRQSRQVQRPGMQLPTMSSGPSGINRLLVPPAPEFPNVVLYDQLNNPDNLPAGSQDFEATRDALDDFAADDFVVPAGQTWNITEVIALGVYFIPPGPAASFYVFVSQDSGTLPGMLV